MRRYHLQKMHLYHLSLKATAPAIDAFIQKQGCQKNSDGILWWNQQQKDLELQH